MRRSVVMLLIVGIAACGGSADGRGAGGVEGEILVSAAASLTDAFADIEATFEVAHPGTDVVLNLAGSSALREQILEGAPVDVFAAAGSTTMNVVMAADLVVAEPVVFIRNRLQIAVPAGNPAGVIGLPDLARDELLIGLCAEGVPCGEFAREALVGAGIAAAVDTNEPNVRALLTKVAEGELDAAITYATDVALLPDDVDGVDIPDEFNVIVEYPIAVMVGATNPDGAAAFLAFVLSDEGQATLSRYGFESP